MNIELYCGELGYQDIEIDASEVEGVDYLHIKQMFQNMSKEEQDKFRNYIIGDDESPIQSIRNILSTLETNEGNALLKELLKEFLSLDEIHENIQKINSKE